MEINIVIDMCKIHCTLVPFKECLFVFVFDFRIHLWILERSILFDIFSSFSKKRKQTKTKTVTRYLHSFLLVGSKNIVDLFALLIILEYSIVLIITEKLDAAEKTRFH